VLLDNGHAAGNSVLAAAVEGVTAVPVADFSDEAVDGLLLLSPATEGPMLVVPLAERGADAPRRPPGASGIAVEEESPAEGEWVPRVHDVARLRALTPAGALAPSGGLPAPVGAAASLEEAPLAGGGAVLESIRRRRSTRSFRAEPMSVEALGRVLAHAFPRPGSRDPEAWLVPEVLETWVVASSVRGLPAGVHRYDRQAHVLTQVRAGNPRRALQQCCLGQELGRDCAAAVVHTVDLPRAVARYGERAYRYAHLESGLLGERLDLAALRLGLGASGIGGFFDRFLNDLLLLGPTHAVTYLTTIGVPA
jgi:SagB-type dehydrogenase family enzyme